jgi:hypothetical protein
MAITVLVAWWCELRPVTNAVVDVAASAPMPADLKAATKRTVSSYYHRSEGFGRTSEWYDDFKVKHAGWPLLALRGVDGPSLTRPFLPSTVYLPDKPLVPPQVRGKAIPLRPVLPGFAVDTLLYGVVAWFGFELLARLRGRLRRFRSRCPGCGYPLDPSTTRCSECGHTLAK